MISLSDIPPYTGSARYNVAVGGNGLLRFLDEYGSTGGIDTDPDFQRGHVWNEFTRIRFVEHLLRGGEHGRTIVWNTPVQDAMAHHRHAGSRDLDDTLVLVDGKQRLTSVLAFIEGSVKVFDGHALQDFDEPSRREIMSATGRLRLQMSVHALQRRAELLRLYLELNEGAVAHSPDEINRVRGMLDQLQKKDDRP